jgi:2-polyprenyl-6-methoxyphenol hydroxylase-like FAD-dependent oxidoreductase
MSIPDYDAIIVGARCAGATLATYLARSGASVLLLDKDKQPSDQILSTHTIHPPGIDVLAYDAPRAMYWAYWDAPAFWRTDSANGVGMYIGRLDPIIRVVFQTDDNQILIGSLPPLDQVSSWRSDPLDSLTHDLIRDPFIRPLVEGSRPEGHVRGTVRERYFFRTAAGPGWALVGDAGHHKDFVIGDGITEALLQAKELAKAVLSGIEQSLYRWWRARDVKAVPLFFFAQDEAALAPVPELVSLALSRAADDQALKARFVQMFDRQLSPYEVFPPGRVLKWALAGSLRGRPRLLAQFQRMGRRVAQVNREVGLRRELEAKEERQ